MARARASSDAMPPVTPRPDGRLVAAVMRRLGQAMTRLELPAVEKISEDESTDPFHVLIATMLSAQTKDAVTAEASARLFRAAPTAADIARLSHARLERLIYPVSFYRNKAKHLKSACQMLLTGFDGEVPSSMDALLTLPGVGRKTANLVLILAHQSADNICVDTHVHRIANRLGWVMTKTPEQTEQALYAAVRRRWWPVINLYLVTWGQNVCRPVYPLCDECAVHDLCPRLGVGRVGRTRRRDSRPRP